MTTHPGRLTADFGSGQRYRLVFDKGRNLYFVDDPEGRSVASVPVGFGGQVRTRTDCWRMATEPRKRGWTVAARTASDGIKVGHISEAILPNTFKILVADRYECRVIENPLNGSWTIRSGRSHVARITDIAQFATGQPPNAPKRPSAELVSPFTSTVRVHQPQGVPAGTITTDATIDPQAPLALAILLTLEMIRAEASIPTIRVDDGSGYSI